MILQPLLGQNLALVSLLYRFPDTQLPKENRLGVVSFPSMNRNTPRGIAGQGCIEERDKYDSEKDENALCNTFLFKKRCNMTAICIEMSSLNIST